MSLQSMLIKKANRILEKRAFQPMPGGQPPQDPNAGAQGGMPSQGMDPSMAGGAPMDPSMMGAGGGMPMDPSMMGGMGGMPMDPSMMAQTATVGSLSITDYQAVMTDMLTNVLQQIIPALVQEALAGQAGPEAAPVPDPSQVAPQDDVRGVSNTEISEKLDALIGLLSQGAGAAPMDAGAAPAGVAPEMGFGGQAAGMPPAPGMEVSAGVKPSRRNGLASIILGKTARAKG